MAKRRTPETPAESDRRKAIAKSRDAVADSRQMMLDTAASLEESAERLAPPPGRGPVILQLGPRDFSVLVWVRDEDGEPIYRVVKEKIKAASTAAVLARTLMQREHARR